MRNDAPRECIKEGLSIEDAEEMFPLSTACNINTYGFYFDKSPWFYLDNEALNTIAGICIEWANAQLYSKANLTYGGKKLITIVAAIQNDYSNFVAKLKKNKE